MDFAGLFTGQNTNSNSKNGNINNDSKHHFFIGCKINDEILVDKLKLVRKKLVNKYNIKELHYPNIVTTNLVYLGYFDMKVAKLYMDKIMRFLCEALVKKYSKLECNMTNFKMVFDGSYYKIMLQLEDVESELKNVMIPFLNNKGVVPIYGNRHFENKASIDIIYFKKSEKIEEQKKKFKKKFKIMLDYPIDKFILDSLVLIKGTPVITRSGYPSTHDQMDFKILDDYKYEFTEQSNKNENYKGNNNRFPTGRENSMNGNNRRNNNNGNNVRNNAGNNVRNNNNGNNVRNNTGNNIRNNNNGNNVRNNAGNNVRNNNNGNNVRNNNNGNNVRNNNNGNNIINNAGNNVRNNNHGILGNRGNRNIKNNSIRLNGNNMN